MERAGFWHRGLAAGLDLIACAIAAVAGGIAAWVALPSAGVSDGVADRVAGAAVIAIALAYTSTEVWLAGTPGKLLLGLRIATSAGPVAAKWTLALRWSAKHFGLFLLLLHAITQSLVFEYLAGFMNVIVLIGCLQALDEYRRTWHDEWAGTAVWRRRTFVAPGPATPPPLPVAAA